MLSSKQKEILDFISEYQKHNGLGPTLDEIAKFFDKTVPTIHQHIQALRVKGYLKSSSVNARGVNIFNGDEEISEIPLLGLVSAGGGIENIENPEPIKVQRSMLSPTGNHYALTVKGTSMIDEGIFPDDIVIIKAQNHADNGDVVIALFFDDYTQLATIKKYYNHGDRIELRPRNPNLSSKIFYPGEIEIRGKFMGLLRKGG